jgi:hypothetical protein
MGSSGLEIYLIICHFMYEQILPAQPHNKKSGKSKKLEIE